MQDIRNLMPPALDRPYVFHEYPKWVVDAAGARVLVQDAEGEARATAPLPKSSTLTLPKKVAAE